MFESETRLRPRSGRCKPQGVYIPKRSKCREMITTTGHITAVAPDVVPAVFTTLSTAVKSVKTSSNHHNLSDTLCSDIELLPVGFHSMAHKESSPCFF